MPLDGRIQALGLDLPNLEASAELSSEHIAAATQALVEALGSPAEHDDGIDIVVAGSLARDEVSANSDFDYFLLAYSLVRDVGIIESYRRAAEAAQVAIGAPPPGATGIFGRMIPASDFVDLIGLEEDSNRNQTRRVLFLEESRSLWKPATHADVRRRVLDRYLYDYDVAKMGVPRFLLNDVVRYWRTLAVDYQAKRWDEVTRTQKKWGLRYLKLRLSRKLTFAGTIAGLFMPRLRGEAASVEALMEQFEMVPLARLAQLKAFLDGQPLDALLEAFRIADESVGRLADKDFRAEAEAVERPTEAPEGSEFSRMRRRAEELEECLETVFLSKTELGQLSRRYLIF